MLERKIMLHDPHGTKESSIPSRKPLLLQPIGQGLVIAAQYIGTPVGGGGGRESPKV